MKYKKGDRVVLNKDGIKVGCGISWIDKKCAYLVITSENGSSYSYTAYSKDGEKGNSCSGCLSDIHFELLNNNTINMKEKFLSLFLKEPEKSFRKAGITGDSGFLTDEGQAVFLQYLLSKHGEEFKKEVVDDLNAEEKDK